MMQCKGVNMKIGIDIDNTITTTMPILKEYCRKYNDEVVKRNLEINKKGFSTRNFYEWTVEEEMNFCNRYLNEIVLKAEVKENAVEIIRKLKQEGNYIYIITARKEPEFKNPYELTKKFLDKNNIIYDELIVGCEDKYTFCSKNNIDIMIDDEPQNINSISKIIPVIVFYGEHNEDCIGKNIIKVDNWKETYNVIENIKKAEV